MQRADELRLLKLLKAEKVKEQHAKVVAAAAEEAAATPAKLSQPGPSSKTPPSLPEDATPAEKYLASKISSVAKMQVTHTGKLDGIQHSVITAFSPATLTRSRGMHPLRALLV